MIMRPQKYILPIVLLSLLSVWTPSESYGFLATIYAKIKQTCLTDGMINRWDSLENDILQYANALGTDKLKVANTIRQIDQDKLINGEYLKVINQFAVSDLFTNSDERITQEPPDNELWEMLKDDYSQNDTTELDLTFTYSFVLREKLAAFNELMKQYEGEGDIQEVDFRSRLRLQNRMDNMENQLLTIRAESSRYAMCQRIQIAEKKDNIRRFQERSAAERNRAAILTP